MRELKVLVVGQTPPPYGGQAVMINKLLGGYYENIRLYHVRLAFSADMSEIGRFKFKKIFHLVWVIAAIYQKRIRYGIRVLYYPPAGLHKIPMFRDLVILISTRWLFDRTIFHFHGGGISDLYPSLPWLLRFLFRKAYWHPDAAILLSELNPADGEKLHAKQQWIIPYGIEDHNPSQRQTERSGADAPPRILYVGLITESKGTLDLIQACGILRERGISFVLDLVGDFISDSFRVEIIRAVDRNNLKGMVNFLGVRTGDDKWRMYRQADIFCFPTYFEAETFGLVVLEAMQFGLPVVATCWRGIPSLISDGENGFLVPIKDPSALASKIAVLLEDQHLASEMGAKGRTVYLQRYTLETYLESMGRVFLTIGS